MNGGIKRSSLPGDSSAHHPPSRYRRRRYSPNGPDTVRVLCATCFHAVASLLILGSPKMSSTSEGIERAMRPSFEGRFVVAEKCRAGTDWKAGTRKLGSMTTDPDGTALLRALLLLGESMLVAGARSAAVFGSPPTTQRQLLENVHDRKKISR